jgi:hypothetical protein
MNGDDIDVKKVLKWVGILALVAIPVVVFLKTREQQEEEPRYRGDDRDEFATELD